MAGHSKWAQIKRQKAVADAKRGNLFTKLANAITVAAKQGGGDPDLNFKLRLAIERAKQANMPKDNIQRAIKRGTGEIGGGDLEEIVYEGFGPDNIGVMLEVVTNNKNRIVSELKHIFSKFGGNLASNGSVAWMFDKKGVIEVELKDPLSEETELDLIEAGAEDWEIDDGTMIVYTKPAELQSVSQNLNKLGLNIKSAELAYLPKETKTPTDKEKWQKFINALEENDDISNIYTNASL